MQTLNLLHAQCLRIYRKDRLEMGWQEPICVEVLFITVFLWASIWGTLEMIADRLGSDARRRWLLHSIVCGKFSVALRHARLDDMPCALGVLWWASDIVWFAVG